MKLKPIYLNPIIYDINLNGIMQYSSAVVSSGPHHNSLETHDALLVPGNANNITNHALPEIHPPPTAAQQLTQALEIHSNPTQVSFGYDRLVII